MTDEAIRQSLCRAAVGDEAKLFSATVPFGIYKYSLFCTTATFYQDLGYGS